MIHDEIKKALCPKIVLDGWWWKKYIPYYKKHSIIMNDLFLYNWMHGGYEKYAERYNQMLEEHYLSIFNSGFTSKYTKDI